MYPSASDYQQKKRIPGASRSPNLKILVIDEAHRLFEEMASEVMSKKPELRPQIEELRKRIRLIAGNKKIAAILDDKVSRVVNKLNAVSGTVSEKNLEQSQTRRSFVYNHEKTTKTRMI